MVCEIIEIEEDSHNGCFPLCACGCNRRIMKGDKVLQTNHGFFLLHDYDRKDRKENGLKS